MDQLSPTSCLDRRSKTRYYLRLFFDLWDMGLFDVYIVYGKLKKT